MRRSGPSKESLPTCAHQNPAHSLTLRPLLALFLSLMAANSLQAADAAYKDLKWKDDIFLLEDKPFTGTAKDQYKSGKPKGEYPFKDGKLHGIVREWWENGQLSTETHFDNGQRHGLNRYWSQSGALMKEQVYDHDKSVSEKHFDVK